MGVKVVATNRKARHEYEIIETIEAGIVLTGTEIKSVREGKVSLKEGFAIIKEGEVWLMDVHIAPYVHGHLEFPICFQKQPVYASPGMMLSSVLLMIRLGLLLPRI